MKNDKATKLQTAYRILITACATALAAIITVALPQPAHADRVSPPDVPGEIEVPAGNKVFLKGSAIGTQNYICLPSNLPSPPNPPFLWTLFGPQATLFEDNDRQIITHFLSHNPDEIDTRRPTWQHSRDTSAVWAMMIRTPVMVPGAIPWLLLQVVGEDEGPTGGDKLTKTTYIQRVNTTGGVAPSADSCTQLSHVGSRVFVPYTADYFFYKDANRDEDDED